MGAMVYSLFWVMQDVTRKNPQKPRSQTRVLACETHGASCLAQRLRRPFLGFRVLWVLGLRVSGFFGFWGLGFLGLFGFWGLGFQGFLGSGT